MWHTEADDGNIFLPRPLALRKIYKLRASDSDRFLDVISTASVPCFRFLLSPNPGKLDTPAEISNSTRISWRGLRESRVYAETQARAGRARDPRANITRTREKHLT